MGNHDAGRAMHAGAKGYWQGRGNSPEPTKAEALAALDSFCEEWRGSDAEFDDHNLPGEPLGRLICIAFDWSEGQEPSSDDEDGEFFDRYYDGPLTAFNERYGFC